MPYARARSTTSSPNTIAAKGSLFGLANVPNLKALPFMASALAARSMEWPALPSLQLATDIVAIEPCGLKHGLVTTEALTQRKFHVTFESGPGRGEMIFPRPLARSQHGCLRARRAEALIGEQGLIEIVGVAPDRGREHAGLLDRHRRALAAIRPHGVRGIAKQWCLPFAPSLGRIAIVERPFVPERAVGVET